MDHETKPTVPESGGRGAADAGDRDERGERGCEKRMIEGANVHVEISTNNPFPCTHLNLLTQLCQESPFTYLQSSLGHSSRVSSK